MLATREPSSAAWIQPMSSAPVCSCCIIAASLPSWPEWNTVAVRRPPVSFLSDSPKASAARFHEWPAGVMSPRRNSLAWARAWPMKAGAASAALAWTKWRRDRFMVQCLSWVEWSVEEAEGETGEQRQQHQRGAADQEEGQGDEEHLSGLGARHGRRHEEAQAHGGRHQAQHQVHHHHHAEVARVDVVDIGGDGQQDG